MYVLLDTADPLLKASSDARHLEPRYAQEGKEREISLVDSARLACDEDASCEDISQVEHGSWVMADSRLGE